jgi:hypothetical protein
MHSTHTRTYHYHHPPTPPPASLSSAPTRTPGPRRVVVFDRPASHTPPACTPMGPMQGRVERVQHVKLRAGKVWLQNGTWTATPHPLSLPSARVLNIGNCAWSYQVDTDGSNVIDTGEVRRLLASLTPAADHASVQFEDRVVQLMGRMDADGNGIVTCEVCLDAIASPTSLRHAPRPRVTP